MTQETSPRRSPSLLPTLFFTGLIAAVLAIVAPPAAAAERAAESSAESVAGAPVQIKQILSKTYDVDRKYRSMMGPWSQEEIFLLDAAPQPELLWIVGYEAVMVGPDGEEPREQEFMCHSNLDIDPSMHRELFDARQVLSGRLFTLSQGQLDIEMPEGFGIPVMSHEPLNLTTQVLNLNHDPANFQVRHKVTIRFVRDRQVKSPMQPLMPIGVYGLKVLDAEQPAHYGMAMEDHEGHDMEEMGPGCLVGENAAGHEYQDALGQRFTGHWVVKPGKEVNHTLVTNILNLPYDTSVHYIAVHLHPFAEWLELRDLTSGETVFKSQVRPSDKGIGIRHVEYFTSEEGVMLYKDHEYELVSSYNNTSSEDQDSMAVMYMYLKDRRFEKPAEARQASR